MILWVCVCWWWTGYVLLGFDCLLVVCCLCVVGLGGLPSFCVVFWFIVGDLRSGCCVIMLFLICHVNVDTGWICRLVAWLVWYLC